MDSLREKLKAYTDLQCPITGPGVRRLEELLTAIVDKIEPEVAACQSGAEQLGGHGRKEKGRRGE